MIDVVTELACEVVLSELLYADDSVLMSLIIDALENKLREWKGSFESNG